MERFSFFGKDRVKLTIEALYSRCDIILVPTKELENWLIVDGLLNSEVRKRILENVDDIFSKNGKYNCVGVHRKKNNEFWMCCDNNTTQWQLSANGRSYNLIFTAQSEQIGTSIDFSSIKLDKKIYAQAVNLKGLTDETTFLEIANAGLNFCFYFINYYALNPFIIIEDLTTCGNGKSNGEVMPKKKREKNVIPLTVNHHKYKIRNGVNVLDTETGRIYPSIAETARRLDYKYGALSYWLKHNLIQPLKRIEKLQKL
jgi:hypothetical protein